MGPETKTQPLGPHALEPHYAPFSNTWKSIASSPQPETEGPHRTWKIPPGTFSKVHPTMSAPQ